MEAQTAGLGAASVWRSCGFQVQVYEGNVRNLFGVLEAWNPISLASVFGAVDFADSGVQSEQFPVGWLGG